MRKGDLCTRLLLWLLVLLRRVDVGQALVLATHRRRLVEQRHSTRPGRGAEHVSAELAEGDVVLFRAGQWFVDGVSVGPEARPSVRLAVVTTLQLVFTTTCEHGWLLGHPATADDAGRLHVAEDDDVQIGPEQVLRKLDVLDDCLTDESLAAVEEATRAVEKE